MELKEGFKLLKLDTADISPESVRQAYKTQVKRYHPDRFANDEEKRQKADDLLKSINVAYELVCVHLKTLPPEKLRPVVGSENPQFEKREAGRKDLFTLFLQTLQTFRSLDIFSFFRNNSRVTDHTGQRHSSFQPSPKRFKDVLKDAQQRECCSGVKKGPFPGKGEKNKFPGRKQKSCFQQKNPSREYRCKRWLHKTGTGPVEAVKPVGRVRGIRRNQ
jgi:curved DNA-binding protein CbpA